MIKGSNILIVDDHLVVRKGIEIMLKDRIEGVVVYGVSDYLEAIDCLKTNTIDLVLLDININGVENVKIMNEIKQIQPKSKILVFSSHDEKQYGLRYVQQGADGYLSKMSSEDKIIEAIVLTVEKGNFYSKDLESRLKEKTRKSSAYNSIDSLSNREYEIAKLLISGYGNLEISNKLNIQMSTVSTYKNRLFEKLNITNVVALAELFRQEQL